MPQKIYSKLRIPMIDTLDNIFKDISSTARTGYRSNKYLHFHQFSFLDQFFKVIFSFILFSGPLL